MKLRAKPKLITPSQVERTNGQIGVGLQPRSKIEYAEIGSGTGNGVRESRSKARLYNNVSEVPPAVRPYYSLGYRPTDDIGEWVYGNCLVCGKDNKFYVEIETGRPSCKVCGVAGNVYNFFNAFYEVLKQQTLALGPEIWKPLEKDRGIEKEYIKSSGIVYHDDQRRWIVPIRNREGAIVNFRVWKLEDKEQGISFRPLGLTGAEELKSGLKVIYKTEAFWDKVALEALLRKTGDNEGVVISSPGAGAWTNNWTDWVIESLGDKGKFVFVHDHDEPGRKGVIKVAKSLMESGLRQDQLLQVVWPLELKEGYDFRDFYKEKLFGISEGKKLLKGVNAFKESILPYSDTGSRNTEEAEEEKGELAEDPYRHQKGTLWRDKLEPLSARAERGIDIQWVIDEYSKRLHMGDRLKDGLRVVYAVILSNQIKDTDPVWVHIIGPPGCGKTQLLTPCKESPGVKVVSTLTPASLVSGFDLKGGRDPSLLPQILGHTFGFKDLTVLLQSNQTAREEIFGIFRDAYDGYVQKPFGTGIRREYSGYFSMITCVTNAIYGHSNSIMGERFLFFRVGKKRGESYNQEVETAISNDGLKLYEELSEVGKQFLSYRIEPSDLPEVPVGISKKVVALAQLVAILRSKVEKDRYTGILAYDPAYETGTRPGRQLTRLLIGLGLQKNPPSIDEEDYRIIAKCALDSCISWNVDIVLAMANLFWREEAQRPVAWESMDRTEIRKLVNVPDTTLWNQLADMVALGVLERTTGSGGKRGRPVEKYKLTPLIWDLIIRSRLLEQARKGGWLADIMDNFEERRRAGIVR